MVDCSGCSAAPVDSGAVDSTVDGGGIDSTVDGGVPADSTVDSTVDSAGTDASIPPGTCRTYNHLDTYFEAGSLIIPMDGICQNDGGDLHAYGIAWHLLRHGIRVSWITKTTKTLPDEADFTITGPSSPVVHRLARSGSYDSFSAIPGPKCVPTTTHNYFGAPLVIAASDADAALQVLYQGSLPDDPSVTYGWGLSAPTIDFSDVEIHRTTVGFTAPVLHTSTSIPRPIALMHNTGWLDVDVLNNIGIIFPLSGGTAASPGLVYDELTEADVVSGTVLTSDRYQMLWVSNDASIAITDSNVYNEISSFVGGGGGVLASAMAILALECNTCAAWDCSLGCATPTQFQGATGLVDIGGGLGTGTTPEDPANPVTQIGDLEYHALGDAPKGLGAESAWNPCTYTAIKSGSGEPIMTVRDDKSMGPVYYITGKSYDNGTADLKRAMQRTVVSLLFLTPNLLQDENPTTYELTRSTPLVIDADDDSEHVVFQGTYDWPDPVTGHYFNASNVAAWNFPITTGHLRAYDLTSLSTGVDDFSTPTPITWPGPTGIVGAGCSKLADSTTCGANAECTWESTAPTYCKPKPGRYVYTATGSSLLTQKQFISTVPATVTTLRPLLGMADDPKTKRLIEAVRSAPLGGVDQSSPAIAVHSADFTFDDSLKRPTVLYVGSHDGMLHAFEVKDVESQEVTSSYGKELWSFILPDQLSKLWENKTAVQGSPSVVDVYGDFLNATGKAGTDSQSEWITLLTITGGAAGRAIYALDVSQPDPAKTHCPTGRASTSCVAGPNPLWTVDQNTSATTADIGGTRKAALGVINVAGTLEPVVVLTTNIGNATGGQGGLRLYVIKATDGSVLFKKSIDYTSTLPSGLLEPNDVPPRVMLVDRDGDKGYQTHAYFADLEGKVWEMDLGDPTSNPVERWDANDILSGTAGKCDYPIAGPMSLYRDSAGQLNLVLATGGISWAHSDATTQQKVVVLRSISLGSTPQLYTVIHTMAPGERIYTAPVVVNEDIYFQSSEALVDQLSGWTSAGAAGTIYVSSVAGTLPGAASSLATVGMTGASLSVSTSGRVISASARGISLQTNATPSIVSTAPQANVSGGTVSRLRLWLPHLKN
ncbi:MAG: hypothetical protein JRH20_17355 [Deltaproteobacteria bacterium]|nr:hypothetical protein [Deltaproteobacteria bacterium]